MLNSVRPIVIALCLTTAACATQAPVRPVATVVAPVATLAEVEAQAAEAEQLGVAIYVLDRAAWVATDVVKVLAGSHRIRGWLTDIDGENVQVTFFGRVDGQPPLALYRVTVGRNAKIVRAPEIFETPQPLTALQKAQEAAVSLARRAEFIHCTDTYNTVAIPRPAAGAPTWSVYLLAAMTDSNIIPAGGHYRFDMDASGSHILDRRAFTKACLPLDSGPGVESLMVSHLLDPTPTEIHVFISLLANKPLHVFAGRDWWEVNGGHIRYQARPTGPAKQK